MINLDFGTIPICATKKDTDMAIRNSMTLKRLL